MEKAQYGFLLLFVFLAAWGALKASEKLSRVIAILEGLDQRLHTIERKADPGLFD